MMDLQIFLPPALSLLHNTETKAVIAAYERCLASGDMDGLNSLRASIEVRRREE